MHTGDDAGEPWFDDRFAAGALDPTLWVDHYLPQWTTPERSHARYDLDHLGLRLRIDADQPAWRDGDRMRVSNIQTGAFSGPLGSDRGTHRSESTLRVQTAVRTQRLWTPTAGRAEVTLQASSDPDCMVAVWLVGFEESSPADSGEICIAELFGNAITRQHTQTHTQAHTRINMGIKAHHDPRLRTEMVQPTVAIDAEQTHSYGAEWTHNRVRFFVDGTLVYESAQAINYPLQLMVDLFEFPTSDVRAPADYPKVAHICRARGWSG